MRRLTTYLMQSSKLVIWVLTELIELGCKMKATQSEIKQHIQGTNSDGRETRTQINSLDQHEETFNQNRMKK